MHRRRFFPIAAAVAVALVLRCLGPGTGGVLARSQCTCGMPFPPDALGGPAPQRLRFGLEEQYLSKQNALEDVAGIEKE